MPRLALALALAASVAACATPPMTREVSDTLDGARVLLTRGQDLVVTLDGNQTTGFRWYLNRAAEPVLKQVGESTYTARAPDGRLGGSGGVTTFRFVGTETGESQLVFGYRRPWEANIPPARRVRFDIRVD
jgi:inhibitor of cysteine peptidase